MKRTWLNFSLIGLMLTAGCEQGEPQRERDAGKRSLSFATMSEGMDAQPAKGDAGSMESMAARSGGRASAPAAGSRARERDRDAERPAATAVDSGKEPDQDAGEGVRCDVSAEDEPTIWLVIDGSGSMLNELGDKTRWTALKDALLDPSTGVVKRFEHVVHWGLMVFDGSLGDQMPVGLLPDGGMIQFEPTTMCPRIVTVPSAPDNYGSISAAFTQYPLGGSTPTHKALEMLLGQLSSTQAPLRNTSIVLATDGEPNDLCAGAGGFETIPLDVRPFVVDAIADAASRGVHTYVINLAADDERLTEHLTEVAKAGATGQSPFTPADQAGLAEALAKIVAAQPKCSP